MASDWTNRGKYNTLAEKFQGASAETSYYLALVTSGATPDADTNTLSDLTEIAAGNGYTAGGAALALNATDFDALVEDDANDWAYVQVKDVVFTASGGNLPASGDGARYAVLLGANATVGDREVYAWFDLSADRVVSDGQPLTIQDCELRLT